MTKQKRLLKFALTLAIVATVAVVVATFVKDRQGDESSAPLLTEDQNKASISLGKVHHTATKDGRKEWSLTADSAHYIESESRAMFDNLKVVFFMEDGTEVRMSADRGSVQTDAKNIKVAGNVKVDNGAYRMETSALEYDHQARRLYTDQPVRVSGATFTLSADEVWVDLESRQSEFKGNVRGNLSEAIDF